MTIASTGRDASGEFVTREYHVEGPVMVFLTTTNIEIDEELLNRCIILVVDEDREQTRAIHDQQRMNETLEGQLMKTDRQESSLPTILHPVSRSRITAPAPEGIT